MKCHQILTGAANRGDRTFGVGAVEGVPFTAYSAGCNVVILSSSFDRVQIIPGASTDNVQGCHSSMLHKVFAIRTNFGSLEDVKHQREKKLDLKPSTKLSHSDTNTSYS